MNATANETTEVRAAEVARQFDLSERGRELLDESQSPREFLDVLIAQDCSDDAVKLLAYWLEPREAVWWGCLALWHAYRDDPPAEASRALKAIVRWLQQPGDANRRRVGDYGTSDGPKSPTKIVAMAAFFSEGSLSGRDLPNVDAPQGLTAKMIAAAVQTLALTARPDESGHSYRELLRLGREVSEGTNHWDNE